MLILEVEAAPLPFHDASPTPMPYQFVVSDLIVCCRSLASEWNTNSFNAGIIQLQYPACQSVNSKLT